MAKVYTKTGDKGTTSLYSGERVEKSSLRVNAYGTIDELDSVLGIARANAAREDVKVTIYALQKELWLLMADIASIGKEATITDDNVINLENIIDSYDEKLEPLNKFIIPGETKSSAYIDLARTVTRRCERILWSLSKQEEVHESNIRYLNRLSDLCFILGRVESEL